MTPETHNQRNTSETREEQNTQNNTKNDSLFEKAKNFFVESKLDKDIQYFDNLINNTADINDNFKSYLNSSSYGELITHEMLKEDNKDDLNKQIKNLAIKNLIPRKTILKNIEKVINKEYKELRYNDIKNKLEEQKNSKLQDILKSEKKRDYFLKNECNIDLSNKKNDLDSLLEGLTLTNQITIQQKDALKNMFSEYPNVTDEDIRQIITLLPLKQDRENIIKFFAPKITLAQAKKTGLISKEKEEELKNNSIDEILNNYNNLDELAKNELKETITSGTNSSDFYFEGDIDPDKLDDSTIKQITTEINKLKSDLRSSEIESDIGLIPDENGSFLDAFKENIKTDRNISKEIRDEIDKLEEGKILNIKYKNGEKFENYILEVTEIGKKGEYMKIKDITGFNGSVYEKGKIEKEIKFNAFKKLLGKVSQLEIIKKTDTKYKELNKVEETAEINSLEELKKELDQIDKKGSEIKWENMCIKAQDASGGDKNKKELEEATFKVESWKGGKIKLEGNPPIDYNTFFHIFKERKCERLKRKINTESVIKDLGKEIGEYKDLMYKDGKVLPKESESDDKHPGITRFISEKKAIDIVKIKDNKITYNIGDYKEKFEEEDDKNGEKIQVDKSEIGNGQKVKSLDDFYNDILRYEMKPIDTYKNNKILNKEEDDKINENSLEEKQSFFKGYLGNLSVTEIIGGGQQILDSIKNQLETGNKLKSAKFALKLGKALPKDIRTHLQATVEGEEKKTMEEMVDHLKQLGSKEMIDKVIDILKEKNSEQYEIEAALFTIVGKYGTLYPKDKLKGLKGEYIWYKKLGGIPKDHIFNKYKNDCDASAKNLKGDKSDQPTPFSEDRLVEQLLKAQAHGSGHNGIKRRSRIEKEYGNALGGGIRDEMEDGAKKAGDKMTIQGRIDYVVGELASGTYPNGIGGLEKIWGKNGSAKEMHAVPFILTVTGVTQSFEQSVLGKLIGEYAFSTPYTSLRFNVDKNKVKLYQNTIKEICKIDDNIDEPEDDVFSDVKKANNFWNKNGEKLIKYLTLQNGKIFALKDTGTEEQQEIFGEFYGVLKGVHTNAEFNNSIKQDDIINEVYNQNNSPLFLSGGIDFFSSHIDFDHQANIRKGAAETLFNEAIKGYSNILNNYNINDKNLKDEERNQLEKEAKKVFKEYYSMIESVISQKMGSYENKKDSSKAIQRLKRLGIDLEFKPENNDYIEEGDYGYINSDRYQKYLDDKWEKYKTNSNLNSNSNETEKELDERSNFYNEIEETRKGVGKSVFDILESED